MRRFEHGGDIASFAEKYSLRLEDVIDLSSNINFVKPHIEANFADSVEPSLYPDYGKLRRALASFYGSDEESLELYTGAGSAIFSLMRFLPQRDVYLYAPLYLEYERAALACSKRVFKIDRRECSYDEPGPSSIVVFVNPSTPDGAYHDLSKLLRICRERGCSLVIDESFLEFSAKESSIERIAEYENLYIVRSVGKYFSAAGVRIGALLSSARNIRKISATEPLWKISTYDCRYMNLALEDKSFARRSQEGNGEAKKILEDILRSSPYVKEFYPSEANFVLARLDGGDAPTLSRRLAQYAIMARECSNFDFLDRSYMRFALKEPRKLYRLGEAMDA